VRNGALVQRVSVAGTCRVEIFFSEAIAAQDEHPIFTITQHPARVDKALQIHLVGFGSVVRALFGNRT
jgi:hypothetical protein